MWKAVIISLLGILIGIQSVDAVTCSSSSFGFGNDYYYRCSSGQECCGTSSCCTSNTYTDTSVSFYTLWYFWLGIVIFFVIICSSASGAYCRHRKRKLLRRTHPTPDPTPVELAIAMQRNLALSAQLAASLGISGFPQSPPLPPIYNRGIGNTKPNMGVAPNPAGPSVAPLVHNPNPNPNPNPDTNPNPNPNPNPNQGVTTVQVN